MKPPLVLPSVKNFNRHRAPTREDVDWSGCEELQTLNAIAAVGQLLNAGLGGAWDIGVLFQRADNYLVITSR